MIQTRMILLLGLVFVAALSRLLPHAQNFTPIYAIALFGGAMFTQKRWAFIVPVTAMLFSDVILYWGQYDAWRGGFLMTSLPSYVCILLIVAIGLWLKKRRSVANIVVTTLSGSALFFLVSNFGWWWFSGTYPTLDFAGLMHCYWAGIPFFKHTIMGDAVYVTLLFGSYAFAERRWPSLQLQASTAPTPAE